MDPRKTFEEFRQLQETIHAYEHAMGLLYYDGDTTAPSASAEGRGRTMGVLSGVQYDLAAGDRARGLVSELRDHADALDARENREVEVFARDLDYTSSIPKQEFVEYQMLLNEAGDVWHRAKPANDFKAFAPYLEKIVAANRRFAGYYKPDEQPYDVLLGLYERGLTMRQCDAFFSALRREIVPLLEQVTAAPAPDTSFLEGIFPIPAQRILSDRVMALMGIDRSRCAIGETEHPFTTGFNKNDARITTHYHEDDVLSSLYSVIHEGGHALYDMGSGDEYEYTCLAGGVSMGIHESQSRFWENLIGRSEAFCGLLAPILREVFPEQLGNMSARQLFLAVNKSAPSLIRTEADELTYALHVCVRYDLEKALIAGDLDVADLPGAWNEKMLAYLGVSVPDDTRGVLQDSHWSGGAIGYFPSYALGSAYGAQMLSKMNESFDVDAAVAAGDLGKISGWLGERIWRHGRMYDPGELLERCCGAPFDPSYFTRYLKEKFTRVYGL